MPSVHDHNGLCYSFNKCLIFCIFSVAVVSFDALSYSGVEGTTDVSLSLILTGIPEGGFQDNTLTVTLTTTNQGKTGRYIIILIASTSYFYRLS